MKRNAMFSVLTIALVFSMGVILFPSCEKDDTLLIPSLPEMPVILEVPDGFEASYHTYAKGFQVYVCTETSPGTFAWVFKEPSANLFSKANFTAKVGTHYAGPTWKSVDGSQVKAAKLQGETVDDSAIPWLLLGTTETQGDGIFDGITHIQRVNTAGGLAPLTPATTENVGEQVEVPYTAEYFFYTAK